MVGARALLGLVLVVSASPLVAQEPTDTAASETAVAGLARFTVEPSPLSLAHDVRPGTYLGVTGPRSAWLGTETGAAEVWVHPLEVAEDFRLAFRIPQYRDPVEGAAVARRIEVRPEATTLTYSHMTFTVRQHILAPRDRPGLLVLLEVDTFVPLEIEVRFRPVLQYMWPGSMGGQYVFWDPGRGAFVLSESLREHNAVIGTSWPAQGEVLPAHRLADHPATFVVPVDAVRASRELIPVAVAAGAQPRDSVFAAYEGLLADARSIYEANRAWADSVLASTATLDTPDDELDLAFAWAKVNLEEQRVCNPDLGCALVAGWGPSGSSSRPGFGWYFGGDAAINSLAMDAVGQWDLVAEDLRFLAQHQRADGKVPHEVSQAAARIPWFEAYPYAYYHADTTPYWMVAVWKLWKASGDDAVLRELWPAYRRAWAWCLSVETDGDGIIENTTGGLGAIEVGGLAEGLHQDIYLAGVWITALEATEEIARHFRDERMERRAQRLRTLATATLDERYWRPDRDQHAFGILRSGETNDNLTAWPGTALAFGLLEPARAERTLRKLATDSISTDWGARLLSVGSALYDPLHYNNGAVWPFMTGFVAWAQYRYRRPWAGFHLVDALGQHAFDWARGRHPENFSGAYYRPLDETVPHQFFASSMLVTPLMRGVLGWEPDAPAGRAALAPQLPPDWDTVRVSRLRVGRTYLDVEIVQSPGGIEVRARGTGPPLRLQVDLPIPLGAQDVFAGTSGRDLDEALPPAPAPEVAWGPHDGRIAQTVEISEGGEYAFAAFWRGGLRVAVRSVTLEPGQESRGVRVVDFTAAEGGWALELEGRAATAYAIDLWGERPAVVGAVGAEATVVPAGQPSGSGEEEAAGRHRLHIRFHGEEGRTTATIRMEPGA